MKKTIKCYLLYATGKYSNGYEVWPTAMASSDDLVFVCSKDVEFEVPDDFDPRPQQITALKEKQNKAAAAFHAMNTDLMRQINELQALEMV